MPTYSISNIQIFELIQHVVNIEIKQKRWQGEPCLIPLPHKNSSGKIPSHLTDIRWCEYIYASIIATFFFMSLPRMTMEGFLLHPLAGWLNQLTYDTASEWPSAAAHPVRAILRYHYCPPWSTYYSFGIYVLYLLYTDHCSIFQKKLFFPWKIGQWSV